jgi:cyclopropane-fatty-acyl-phospholipid synthase
MGRGYSGPSRPVANVAGNLNEVHAPMNRITRELLRVVESVVYGPIYGKLQYLIRSPEPLDAETAWNSITQVHPKLVTWFVFAYPPRILRPLLIAAKMRQDHVLGIGAHYDVSNDFFELWHDKVHRFYTAGDFHSPEETLEEAQTHKADRFIELLEPRAGEKILELGPGWGPMLRRIHEETGDKASLYGYTLSEQQLKYNNENDGFQVEFRDFVTTDYPSEFFDKVYSVEAIEHCRPRDIPMLARKLYAAMKPGGVAVHQYSCRMAEPLPTTVCSAQLFFPGSIASSYGHMFRSWEAAGFRIVKQDILDYRPTLRAWFDRLIANRDRAVKLVGAHNYNRYLLMCSSSWRYINSGWGQTVRVTMQKPKVRTGTSARRSEPALV